MTEMTRADIYGRIATRYARMHRRWLRHAGGEAQAAFEAALLGRVSEGDRVLDAGGGTGELARHLLTQRPNLSMTVLDACPTMLSQADDLNARCIRGCLLDLPFKDADFDVVSAAWSIETTSDPKQAIAELLRVLRPGGSLVMVFCSDAPAETAAAQLLRFCVGIRGTGAFLNANSIEAAIQAESPGALFRLRSHGPATALWFTKAKISMPREALVQKTEDGSAASLASLRVFSRATSRRVHGRTADRRARRTRRAHDPIPERTTRDDTAQSGTSIKERYDHRSVLTLAPKATGPTQRSERSGTAAPTEGDGDACN
ncbi:MAG: methyltransferase domain-containing protein [Pseudomonadota bacterium]